MSKREKSPDKKLIDDLTGLVEIYFNYCVLEHVEKGESTESAIKNATQETLKLIDDSFANVKRIAQEKNKIDPASVFFWLVLIGFVLLFWALVISRVIEIIRAGI